MSDSNHSTDYILAFLLVRAGDYSYSFAKIGAKQTRYSGDVVESGLLEDRDCHGCPGLIPGRSTPRPSQPHITGMHPDRPPITPQTGRHGRVRGAGWESIRDAIDYQSG